MMEKKWDRISFDIEAIDNGYIVNQVIHFHYKSANVGREFARSLIDAQGMMFATLSSAETLAEKITSESCDESPF